LTSELFGIRVEQKESLARARTLAFCEQSGASRDEVEREAIILFLAASLFYEKQRKFQVLTFFSLF